jgi:hypothetical protein
MPPMYPNAMYQVIASENGTESIAHPAGEYKAAFGPSRFFGRDALREVISEMGLQESEALLFGSRRKVFHNDEVVITMTKDPWQDYPRDASGNKVKEPVYREEWGGQLNPLKPARSGIIRITGSQSAVMSAYNHINWRTFNDWESLGTW